MKRVFLLTVIFLLCLSSTLYGQRHDDDERDGFFIDFSLGFEFPMGEQVLGVENNIDPLPFEDRQAITQAFSQEEINALPNELKYQGAQESISGSFGEGFGMSADFGYWLNSQWAFTFGVGFVGGSEFDAPLGFLPNFAGYQEGTRRGNYSATDPFSRVAFDGSWQYNESGSMESGSMWQFKPGFKLQITEGRTFNPYMKAGLTWSGMEVTGSETLRFTGEEEEGGTIAVEHLNEEIDGISNEDVADPFIDIEREYRMDYEYESSFDVGWYAELGMSLSVGEQSDLLFGFDFYSQSHRPESLNINELVVEGISVDEEDLVVDDYESGELNLLEEGTIIDDEQIGSVQVRESYDLEDERDVTDEGARLEDQFPFDSWGFKVGYSYTF